VLPRQHVAIFGHGCYWHAHWCARGAQAPDDRAALKRRRDLQAQKELSGIGYRVATIWECSLIGPAALLADELGLQLIDFIEGSAKVWSVPSEQT
jgi:DNA mismatch endonuclease (patch repair protein)